MSDTTTFDVRLTPAELDNAEQLVETMQTAFPQMTVDDAFDFIFRVGLAHLRYQNVLYLDGAVRMSAERYPRPPGDAQAVSVGPCFEVEGVLRSVEDLEALARRLGGEQAA